MEWSATNEKEILRLEQSLMEQRNVPYYEEHIEKYNGTGDAVVVTTPHPVDYMIRYHSHTFYEINWVLKGDCLNLVEGQSLHMRQGDFILLHPQSMHTLYSDRHCKVFNILITVKHMEALAKRLQASNHPLVRFLKAEAPYKYLLASSFAASSSILREMVNSFDAPERALYREALLAELFCACLDQADGFTLSEPLPHSTPKIKEILTHMNAYYRDTDLEQVARQFHYSKSHVCKLLKTHTGMSFTENLNAIRIRKAQVFLVNSSMPVNDVAQNSGYGSIEYFYRIFKTHTGMTPLAYRRKFKNTK